MSRGACAAGIGKKCVALSRYFVATMYMYLRCVMRVKKVRERERERGWPSVPCIQSGERGRDASSEISCMYMYVCCKRSSEQLPP